MDLEPTDCALHVQWNVGRVGRDDNEKAGAESCRAVSQSRATAKTQVGGLGGIFLSLNPGFSDLPVLRVGACWVKC